MNLASRSPSAVAGASRRSFLQASVAAAAAATFPGGAFAAGRDRLRIGLVGCGGRGVGAALQAVAADGSVTITALGDLFADQLADAVAALAAAGCAAPRDLFHGPRAADLVIGAEIDAVILATPPCFRPAEIAAAVRAGRHVYAEAPTGVDAAGVQAAAAAVAEGRSRGLSLAAGLPSRYHGPTRAAIGAIADGAIGRTVAAIAIRQTGLPWVRPLRPGWSAEEAAVRNWVADPRLSGGCFLVDLVGAIDRCMWGLGEPTPLHAIAVPPEDAWPEPPARGIEAAARIFFANGSTLRAEVARREGIEDRVEEFVIGSRGTADLRRPGGGAATRLAGDAAGHAACMASFVASVRSGPHRDDLHRACRTTMLAILAKTAVEAAGPTRWDDLWRLSPAPRST